MIEPPQDNPRTDTSFSPGQVFQTTHWSWVLSAADGDHPEAHAALSRLCQTYWMPIYAFVRKRGHAPHAAEDLVQEFFARFLEKQHVAKASRERGRFRSFLMTSVENFLRNAHERSQAQKRGGGVVVLPLAGGSPEEQYLLEPEESRDPAQAFEQRWASVLLHRVLQQLRSEYALAGREALFEALQIHLWGDADSVPYPSLAEQFGMSLGNVKSTAHRLRLRYRELLREEIAQTVADPAEVDDEIRHLMKVVSQ